MLQLHRRPLRARHPVPGARRRAADRPAVDRPPSRTPTGPARGRVLVPAALLRRRRRPAARLPRPRDPVVALEVASLPAFALVGTRRGDRLSSEAALKFFLSSVTATAVMLLGVSFVYASTGTLHLTEIADPDEHVDRPAGTPSPSAGVVLTLVGFAFKTAAVALPLLGARHLRRRAPPDRRVPVGRRQGRRLLRPDPGHRRSPSPRTRDVWGPALAVAGRAHHDRRQRRRPPPAARRARTAPYGCSPGPRSARPATSWSRSPPPRTPTTPTQAIGSTVAYALMYAAVNLGAFAVAALVARTKPAQPHQRLPRPVRPRARSPPSPSASSCSASPDCRRASSACSPRSPSSPRPSTRASAGSPWSWPSTS